MFGAADLPAATAVLPLAGLDGSNGFRLDGIAAGDFSSYAIAAVGDIDGDGFDDVAIGAPRTDVNGYYSGSSYIVFGRADGFPPAFGLDALDGSNGFRLDGGHPYIEAGRSIAGAGDINGDGFDDLIVGAPFDWSNGDYSGSSYVVFGRGGGFPATLDLDELDGSNGFRLDGAVVQDTSGFSVAGAGDVNGDGFGDLLIGAPFASAGGDQSGSSFVVLGHAGKFAPTLALSTLDGNNGFRIDGAAAHDNSGRCVAAAGDVNGDGFDDILIGASMAGTAGLYSGASYVVFGHAGAFTPNISLGALDGTDGFRLDGAAAGEYSGFSAAGGGDLNGDGVADLVIGADRADIGGENSGSSYVVFGRVDGFASHIELSMLDGGNGFRINGAAAGDFAGNRVSMAGDVNGDGISDLLIGAFGADSAGERSGSSYLVFGHRGAFAANLALGALDGDNGYRLDGVAPYDNSGASVSAAGDVNGDGIADLLVGAPGADPNGENSGSSYLVFGARDDRLFCDGFDGGTCASRREHIGRHKG